MSSEQLQAAARAASPQVAATTTDQYLQAAIAAERPDLHGALATNPALYPELREWLAEVSRRNAAQAVERAVQNAWRAESEAAESGAGEPVAPAETWPTASAQEVRRSEEAVSAADAAQHDQYGQYGMVAEPTPAVEREPEPTAAEPEPVTGESASPGAPDAVVDYAAATTVLPAGAWREAPSASDKTEEPHELQDPVLSLAAATTVLPTGWRPETLPQPGAQSDPQQPLAFQPPGSEPAAQPFTPPGAQPLGVLQPQPGTAFQPQAPGETSRPRGRRTWVIVLAVALVVALVGVGVAVGIALLR